MNKTTTTIKKKIVWRLGKLPSVDELLSLYSAKVITVDEVREIMFTLEDANTVDRLKSLNSNQSSNISTTAPGTIRHIQVFPI